MIEALADFWKRYKTEQFNEETLPRVYSSYVQKLTHNPRFLARLKQPVQVFSTKEVPWISGYSINGREVYFDKNFKPFLHYRGKLFDTRDYILLHEVGEKALRDLFQLSYKAAHNIMTRVESEVVAKNGLPWLLYSRFILAQMNKINSKTFKNLPDNLDSSSYTVAGKDIRQTKYKIAPQYYRNRH